MSGVEKEEIINENIIKIKRTRKSKKQILIEEANADALIQSSSAAPLEVLSEPQIKQIITPVIKAATDDSMLELAIDDEEENENVIVPEKVHKKRGRKPKGGKITVNNVQSEQVFIPIPNVIMHLKCKSADLIQPEFLSSIIYNPSINQVETFKFGHEMGYDIIQSSVENTNNSLIDDNAYPDIQSNSFAPTSFASTSFASTSFASTSLEENTTPIDSNNPTYNANDILCKEEKSNTLSANKLVDNNEKMLSNHTPQRNHNNNDNEMKVISSKLKELTTNLHLNNISYKKSACFWCTHDFDNPPIFIPKHEINGVYHCYGCFCSPECATAFLFKEHIDTATRFERYHLINHIYCKIYGYTKNVKPAPDPFYLLNKYYGNLTIQEYRQLLKNERLLIIVDKPLSRTLPELHEDNDDFMFNGKTIPSASKFKLKTTKNKQTMKSEILNEQFNIK